MGYLSDRRAGPQTAEARLTESSRMPLKTPFARALLTVIVAALFAVGCGALGPSQPSWPPLQKKWFERAKHSFQRVDIDDAQLAVSNALRIDPHRQQVRVLAARVALAELEFDRAVQLLQGINTSEAHAIRARALWYAGDLEQAADELDKLLADPDVHDPWAEQVVKLARQGAGRKPFRLSGGLLAVTEMPQVSKTALVVPVDVNGEPGLGLIATGTAEAYVDSSGGNSEPAWVSLRFGNSVEVHDVPALPKDLSGISQRLKAPIKMLIGVNLLRHLHCTFDFTGGQFVVRTFEPPPPPHATTVKLAYVRGGGMVLRSALGSQENAPRAALLVDTTMTFPLALDAAGWKKAGVKLAALKGIDGSPDLRRGVLPVLRLGAFEVPGVPAIYGAPIDGAEQSLGVRLDGIVGSGLLAAFRVTLVDGGRTMWLEDIPTEALRTPKLSGENVQLPSREEQLTPPAGVPPTVLSAPKLAPPPGASPKTAPKHRKRGSTSPGTH